MKRCFYVSRRYDATKSKARLLLNELYGDPVRERERDAKFTPAITFFPLTGIYGLREDHIYLVDFTVKVIYVEPQLTKISIYMPGFRSAKRDIYQYISPTLAAYHFNLITKYLTRGFLKYIYVKAVEE